MVHCWVGHTVDILLDDDVPEDKRGVEGEAAGFREGEWMEVKVICTARVPIVNIVIGGFPFLRYDDAYAAAIAEATGTSTQLITFECDVRILTATQNGYLQVLAYLTACSDSSSGFHPDSQQRSSRCVWNTSSSCATRCC